MHSGDLVGDRFELEHLAGSGGMGEVYKALDRHTGQPVAIKLLRGARDGDTARFVREARILAEIDHPHIVRYVAQGALPSGERYLVMEWLDGEDLSARLARGRLSPGESVTLAARIAEVLGFTHARGIVHRDLKPSNVFLPGGKLDSVKLLDFGIAQLGTATRMTRTGALMGTPGYMAPEQARGSKRIDARADVFSLGCVLFECLTGEPAFAGAHMVAILAKLLFDQPPSVRERHPELPETLDALVSRMLSKSPEQRPPDGIAVARALRALGEMSVLPLKMPRSDGSRPKVLTGNEQRAVAVILISASPSGDRNAREPGETETMEHRTEDALRREVELHGGHFEQLLDGTLAIVMFGAVVATDLAAQAARCALSLRPQTAGRFLTLAMGRGEVTGRFPMGHAIDRAARLMQGKIPFGFAAVNVPIALDEVAAGLLDVRFDVREGDAGFTLLGERDLADGTRTLLGKATPCVGRERELHTLETLLDECTEEGVAQAVLVTAPPGAGKSRLAQEFLRHVKGRDERMAIWISRGDSLRAGSAFTLLAQTIRSACAIRDGEPVDVRKEKLVTRVAERVLEAERGRVAEFLGEIIGTPFPDEDSPPLRAARKDAQLMNDQMRAAFLDFLAAESQKNPVLFVLEDLHWGDRPTVQFLDRALLELRGKAVFVLATARPEVHELFPKLWDGRRVQEVRLHRLSPKAIERLSRHVLGASAGPETIERLVRLSEGNAFYLEELIRATAQGRGADLPETVVAMVQSRLGALDDASRRLLRAASVFGDVFWAGSVAVLLGGAGRIAGVREGLSELVVQELILKRNESRFPEEEEYAFRHALLREGAYAMLTQEDRTLGHRLAGEWLEHAGDPDPAVLAEHFERGGERARAAHWHAQTAELAVRANDFQGAITAVGRGLAADTEGRSTAELWALQTHAAFLMGNAALCLSSAEEVLRRATPGSVSYCLALGGSVGAALMLGQLEAVTAAMDRLLVVVPAHDATTALSMGLTSAVVALVIAGQRDAAALYLGRMSAIAAGPGAEDPASAAWMEHAAGYWERYVTRDPWQALRLDTESERHFTRAGDLFGETVAASHIGVDAALLGAFEEGEGHLIRAHSKAFTGKNAMIKLYYLAILRLVQGAAEQAVAAAIETLEEGRAQGERLISGLAAIVLAEAQTLLGNLAEADDALGSMGTQSTGVWMHDAEAGRVRARILLARGRAAEAALKAEEAITLCHNAGVYDIRSASTLLTRAEAYWATGNIDAAKAAIREARDDLLTRASKIEAPKYRQSFLERVPTHARTLMLARDWLVT